MYAQQISHYLSTTRPTMWNQMSTTDRNNLIDQVAAYAAELEANPPWPAPTTDDHRDLVIYRRQVHSWAAETAMAEQIYQTWPAEENGPTDPEEQRLQEQHAETQQTLDELRREQQAFFDSLDSE